MMRVCERGGGGGGGGESSLLSLLREPVTCFHRKYGSQKSCVN